MGKNCLAVNCSQLCFSRVCLMWEKKDCGFTVTSLKMIKINKYDGNGILCQIKLHPLKKHDIYLSNIYFYVFQQHFRCAQLHQGRAV